MVKHEQNEAPQRHCFLGGEHGGEIHTLDAQVGEGSVSVTVCARHMRKLAELGLAQRVNSPEFLSQIQDDMRRRGLDPNE